jgi:hypothetical protein
VNTDAPTTKDVRALCAWLGCRYESTVQVEYGPGDPLPQMPLLDSRGGYAYLCADHAAEFRRLLGPQRLLSEKIVR